jgi:N-acetylglucosaminyldiphosphoundecaprenol N-acetyl-beta-D-mannosaminyltransferase
VSPHLSLRTVPHVIPIATLRSVPERDAFAGGGVGGPAEFAPHRIDPDCSVTIMSVSVQLTESAGTLPVQKPLVPDFSRPVFCLQGLLCDLITVEEAKQRISASINEARRCNIVTPNANFLTMIRSDPEFRDAALANDLSLVDGMPLVWLARLLGIPVDGRAAGSDLFESLMASKDQRFRAFFFGATREIGERVRDRLERSNGVHCTGAYAPGFGSIESMSDPSTIAIINQASADLLVVSIGARKGLLWLNQNEHRLLPPVVCNLGATVNFVAGSVKRAPLSLQRWGLEWLWRIKEEPVLWTRYARDLRTLLFVLFRQVLPCLIHSCIIRRAPEPPSATRLQVYHGRDTEILRLSGSWTKDNLAPVRAALAAATRRPRNLVMDVEGVTFVDAMFLGQVLLAYGYQRRMHRGFLLRASGGRIRRILRLHGCGYLLQTGYAHSDATLRPLALGSSNVVRKLWRRMVGLRGADSTDPHSP